MFDRNSIRNSFRLFGSRPQISVIMPVFNKAEFLFDCLESILTQSVQQIEILCIDDGSFDSSTDIIKTFMKKDHRVYLISNDRNLGPGPSRNKGIFAACGKYVQFTDADDLLPEGALLTLLKASRRTGAPVVRGGVQSLRGEILTPIRGQVFPEEKVGTLGELPEIWKPWYHHSYLIDRRYLISSSILFPPLRAGEDPVFIAGITSSAESICVTPEIVYTHRSGEERSPLSLGTLLDYISHSAKVREIYSKHNPEYWVLYKDFIRDDTLRHINNSILSSDDKVYCENALFEALSDQRSV